MWRSDLTPEARAIALEVFDRSWHFIENDPVLAAADRGRMQEQLAQLILALMQCGERNSIVLANRAISNLRQQYAVRRRGELETAA